MRAFMLHQTLSLLLLIMLSGQSVGGEHLPDDMLRYRGDYTLGHEVNQFCPKINSQCYWLGPVTPQAIRAQLKELVEKHRSKPYDAVCVVIKGRIDRDSERQGFAADYDGLINIDHVYDECSNTHIVTQGDLQHHRWMLSAINNEPVDASQWNLLPTLDFGEQMFVEANDGCRQFSSWTILKDSEFLFQRVTFVNSFCISDKGPEELQGLSELNWAISLPKDGVLRLQSNELILDFKRNDWR